MNKEQEMHIITALGLQGETKEKQEEVIIQLGGQILEALIRRATEKMSDDTLRRFDAVLGENDSSAVQSFLEESVPELPDLLKEVSAAIVESYKEGRAVSV